MKYWERKEQLFKYVDGVRQFFPLAKEQLDTIARVIEKFNPSMNTFLDLGCGDGFLGYFIAVLYPDAQGVFLDFSKEMIDKARKKDKDNKFEFFVQDFGAADWHQQIGPNANFDLIISGFSIHHIDNEKKKRLYKDIFNMLKPNGIFLNLEHVSSSTAILEDIFFELFDEGMYDYQKKIGDEKTIDEIKEMYHDPEHKKMNILESVEKQCAWLRQIGFEDVDCYMKIFELALFGGIKRENEHN
jgi:tRNA (cmo5U34)-methyltransferase